MTKKRIRTYVLYTDGPWGRIEHRSIKYHKGMWIANVKAFSLVQAKRLFDQEVYAKTEKDIGIYGLDNSAGPHVGYPWAQYPICPPRWITWEMSK